MALRQAKAALAWSIAAAALLVTLAAAVLRGGFTSSTPGTTSLSSPVKLHRTGSPITGQSSPTNANNNTADQSVKTQHVANTSTKDSGSQSQRPSSSSQAAGGAKGASTYTRVPQSKEDLDLLLAKPGAKFPTGDKARGKEYQWVLSERARQRGVGYMGTNERLRIAVERMRKGEQTNIVFVGGSVTAGQGADDAPPWTGWLMENVQSYWGPHVHSHNGAVAGAVSSYMSLCLTHHIPKDAHIVFVEYSVSDAAEATPVMESDWRRSFERLLRKLLQYPNNPAVVLLHSFRWTHPQDGNKTQQDGTFWATAETDFMEYSLKYSLPSLTLKGCCYPLMVAGVPGFAVSKTRAQLQKEGKGDVKDVAFFRDEVHPDGNTGHRVLGELAFHLLLATQRSLEQAPLGPGDTLIATKPLPLPVAVFNIETMENRCLIGQDFSRSVASKQGFEFVGESKDPRQPQGAVVATQPGSKLTLAVNTTPTATSFTFVSHMMVEILYVRSWQGMGQARVSCVGGCGCAPWTLDGHMDEPNYTKTHVFQLPKVSQAPVCNIEIEVLSESSSKGGHMVVITGVIFSEQAGDDNGIRMNGTPDVLASVMSLKASESRTSGGSIGGGSSVGALATPGNASAVP